MKKIIIMCVLVLLSQKSLLAQGTVYVSNLGQTSTGSASIGSDSWFAASFVTGNNIAGYSLNSVQLALTDATGNPDGFTAMIYSAVIGSGIFPGNNVDTLDGSLNPTTAGIYAYTDSSNITLSPKTAYFLVLTAGTPIANDSYEWSITDTPSPGSASSHWDGEVFFATSSDGLNWSYTSGSYGQYAITATPVPEPSPSLLLLLGSGIFVYARRTFRR